jgi:aldose 1-epimerase
VLLFPLMMQAADYSAKRVVLDGVEVVELADAARHIEVSIAVSVGNMAYSMKADGKDVFCSPSLSPGDLKTKPTLCSIPFLAPWANRVETDAFWLNDKKYLLNPGLGNVRPDNHGLASHGFLMRSTAWSLVSVHADKHSASSTSRLEFWKHPEMMAQFPFAHTITMTYRLADGALEVETTLQNESVEPMPVAIGYHPCYQVHDAPRDQWKIHLPARDHVVLTNLLVPTGERKPMELADPLPMLGVHLDDVFTNLVRGPDGRAQFWLEGQKERVTISYGPKYQVAVVYAPARSDSVCFEPMAAITNAFSLAHAGVYKELQSIPAGGQWKESFWVTPSGF